MQPIPLWPTNPPYFDASIGQPEPTLTPFLLPGAQGAVIVCPGGGYTGRADHEGEPIAKAMNGLGYSAFVLNYRVAPYTHPVPLTDAQRAIRLVRSRAAEWGLDKNKIAILGFSAGGHLAGMSGVCHDQGDPNAADPVERESCRPDAMVLCYGALSMVSYYHSGSCVNLTGSAYPSMELRRALSVELLVGPDTPPAFLWHTANDAGVPVENSLLVAAAMARYSRPFGLHVFPEGRHGLGLAGELPDVAQWVQLLGAWFERVGF